MSTCTKKRNQKVYHFNHNPSYVGPLNISNYKATAIVTDVDSGITIEVDLIGADPNTIYPTHVHIQDLTQPYGFHGFPVIGIHEIHNGHATSNFSKDYTFENFTKNFRGYLLIHDPRNSNDTTTHVIFGKIGGW